MAAFQLIDAADSGQGEKRSFSDAVHRFGRKDNDAACASVIAACLRIWGDTLQSGARVDVDILPGKVASPIEPCAFSLMDANRDHYFWSFSGSRGFLRGDRGGSSLRYMQSRPK